MAKSTASRNRKTIENQNTTEKNEIKKNYDMSIYKSSELEAKNESLYDVQNKPGFVDYEVEVQLLKCCACGRRGIKDTAEKCPACKSYDLIPDKTEKIIKPEYKR